MQGVDETIQQILDGFDIVENAIIGALGQRQYARLNRTILGEGIGRDLALDVFGFEFLQRDGADDAVVIARRHEKYGDGSRHDDGVEDGFVTVAVYDHDIACRHGGVPYDLVGGGGAVGHEKQMIGIENACGIAL